MKQFVSLLRNEGYLMSCDLKVLKENWVVYTGLSIYTVSLGLQEQVL